jgi:hypothetical protein
MLCPEVVADYGIHPGQSHGPSQPHSHWPPLTGQQTNRVPLIHVAIQGRVASAVETITPAANEKTNTPIKTIANNFFIEFHLLYIGYSFMRLSSYQGGSYLTDGFRHQLKIMLRQNSVSGVVQRNR